MKTRTALVSTLAAGLGLLACNKAADTLGPSESNPTGTATLAARISAGATHEDSALLRKTQTVRATLDTGDGSTGISRLETLSAAYLKGSITFPKLRVGTPYSLKLEGMVGSSVIWSGTLTGTIGATSSENAAKLEVTGSTTLLVPPEFEKTGTGITLKTLSDNALGAFTFWTTDTNGTWTNAVTLIPTASTTYWIKDSIVGVVGSAMSMIDIKSDGSLDQDTLAAPTITLMDPMGNQAEMSGWAKLTLTDNAAGSGTLQYSLDSKNWKNWSDSVRLYGTDTVYARAYKSGAHSHISEKSYVVTPLTLPKPNVVVNSSSSKTTVTLKSNTSEDYPGAVLYYSTNSGTNWTKYVDVLSYGISQTILVKDSLIHQLSTWDTVQVTIQNAVPVAKPTVSVATAYGAILRDTQTYQDEPGGLKEGTNGIDTLKTILATCPQDLQIQYRPSSATDWTNGTPANLTKADSIYFRCALNATSVSESVPALFRILQRPALSIGDSSFYGSLTVKIANDSPSLLGQVPGETYNYCIESTKATGCTSGIWKTAKAGDSIALDTSAQLWINRQWSKGDSTWVSSPTVRNFTKASLANSGKLYFTTPAANLQEASGLYGIQSYTDKEGTTTKQTVTSGSVLRFEATATGYSQTPFAGFTIPLRSDYASFDLSNVTAIKFDYKTSEGVTDFTIAPYSLKYPSPEDGEILTFPGTLSINTTQAAIGIPNSLHFPAGWGSSPNRTYGWDDIKTGIQSLQFTINVKAGMTSSVEISNLQLILVDGKTFPLPVSN